MVVLSYSMVCLQLDAITVRQSPLPVILLFVVFVGLCDGVAQGAIFGDVALLPPKYTQVCLTPFPRPSLPSAPVPQPQAFPHSPRGCKPLSHRQAKLECKTMFVMMAPCALIGMVR